MVHIASSFGWPTLVSESEVGIITDRQIVIAIVMSEERVPVPRNPIPDLSQVINSNLKHCSLKQRKQMKTTQSLEKNQKGSEGPRLSCSWLLGWLVSRVLGHGRNHNRWHGSRTK